jgi:NADH-quinone oxidoreductase E subunit
MSEAVARQAASPVAFGADAMGEYERIIARYPQRRAALMPVLWLAQREFGWISPEVQAYVAGLMGLPVGWVEGAVTFYTMYYRRPMGIHVQVCTNLSCRLRGADRVMAALKHRLAIEPGETTRDGRFSLDGVECLGSCGTAPVVQIGSGRFFENIDEAGALALLDALAAGTETGQEA